MATSDNNGTFIESLKMGVFNVSSSLDEYVSNSFQRERVNSHSLQLRCLQGSDYAAPLEVPPAGLELRSSIYVEVEAVNLTGK